MRTKEYIELALRSLRLRKKSNRSTVIALSLGFALLIPVISALFGVNVSMNRQLNASPYLLYFESGISDYRVKTEDFGEKLNGGLKINVSGSNNIDFITDDKNLERTIIYEQYALSGSINDKTMKISVDGGELTPLAYDKKSNYSIIDADKSDGFFPLSLTENYPGGIFADGYGESFSGSGKGQVVVSEKFLSANGLTPESVYKKTISIYNKDVLSLSEGDPVEIDGYICNNYTVQGVIKKEVSELYRDGDFMASDLFFTSASVYDSSGSPVLKPRYYRYGEKEYERYLIYDNLDRREELNREYMMLGWYQNYSLRAYNRDAFAATSIYSESGSFQRLKKDINRFNARLSAVTGVSHDFADTTEFYEKYKLIYDLTNIVSLILIIVSAVIGFSALLNMFCSISHSVKERSRYLTLMRAIGAKDSAIPRLYMTEAAILCSISGAVMAVVGFLLSMAVKLIYEGVLAKYKITATLGIPWWTIIAATLATVVAVYAVSILFAYLTSRKLSKRKITEILSDD